MIKVEIGDTMKLNDEDPCPVCTCYSELKYRGMIGNTKLCDAWIPHRFGLVGPDNTWIREGDGY